jgi:hypothetical protein
MSGQEPKETAERWLLPSRQGGPDSVPQKSFVLRARGQGSCELGISTRCPEIKAHVPSSWCLWHLSQGPQTSLWVWQNGKRGSIWEPGVPWVTHRDRMEVT